MKDRKKYIEQKRKISRRKFLGGVAATTAAFTIVPRHVLGGAGYTAPSEKLNIAGVGVGGMGQRNLVRMAQLARKGRKYLPADENAKGENIVALCDVDHAFAAETFDLFPKAKRYKDFREMLEKQKDIDAVMVATPDHTHAVIAIMAIKMGKHVYVQKPLTYSVHEARMLTEAAREYKVATQMGNQGHSGEGVRLLCEWIWDGAIGPVREVHAWTDRPIWPQGVSRPVDTPPVPKTLDWELWLGPAPYRPYHPAYHPRIWRGWRDFGTGALGDMACHVLDPVFWALKLKYPTSVEASRSEISEFVPGEPWGRMVKDRDSYPRASIVRYKFPAREGMPEVKLYWYDGGLLPPRPDDLELGRKMGIEDNGTIFIGDKGKIMSGPYGDSPRLIPEAAMKAYKRPPKTLERIEDDIDGHERNWIRACKGGPPACSNFEYSGPFTETVSLGTIAVCHPRKKLLWDGVNMKVTNFPEANELVQREYRQGWSL
jgi:predicted dehydrogenase